MLLLRYDPMASVTLAAQRVPQTTGYADTDGSVGRMADALVEAGLRLLGVGAYGVAVELHDGSVLKMSCSVDDPWREFIQWCLHMQEHSPDDDIIPFLPVIYRTKKLPSGHFVAIMERLERVGSLDELPEWVVDRLECERPRGAEMDLHTNNFMLRGDEQYVVTDPWRHIDYSM